MIKLPPYKYEKKQVMKVKSGKCTDFIGRKNKMEDKLLDQNFQSYRSENIYTPSDFNELGRVWTF